MKNGKLIVPDYPTIGYIRGDGVGEDIFPQAKRVFDAAVLKIFGEKKKIGKNYWQAEKLSQVGVTIFLMKHLSRLKKI